MMYSYQHALAPGTIKNRAIQAQLYIKFCLTYGINYLAPSKTDVSMLVQFLGNSFDAPATVKNYLSGAKLWVSHRQGDPSGFGSPKPASVKYIVSTSTHQPSPALSLSPVEIKIICEFIDTDRRFQPAIKACILITFTSFLRASDVASPSVNHWGGPHTLQARDIIRVDDGLILVVRSTKTLSGKKPTFIKIDPVPGGVLCPVATWDDYYRRTRPCPIGPAFMMDSCTPLTTKPVVQIMRAALQQAGYEAFSVVTFHSLRRGGARTAASAGAPEKSVMNHGTWNSKSGMKPYIAPDQRIVPCLLARSLAN